jgi:glycosyltransferase involved in cell wall biosynthesis
MRIAFFSWESTHSIHIGGIAVHVTELACALQRKGNEVHVFTRMGQDDHSNYECIHGVHYHRCAYGSDDDFLEEINNMCRSFVEEFFKTEDRVGIFDIIHAHDWLTVNAMASIKEESNRKSILTLHSTEYGRCGNNFYGGRSEKVRQVEWHGTYCADHVITVSKALKDESMWIYSIPEWKVDVVYNGINPSMFDGWIDPGSIKKMYGIGPMDPTILFAGRMVTQKGPDLLVGAIPNILNSCPNAKFIFAGDGEMRYEVENQANQLGIGHATRFLGQMRGIKLHDLFKACDMVCVPSRNEPFGIVILEAWSAGKPVVSTTNGGPNEFIWHQVNGIKTSDTSESIAGGIRTLLNDFDYAKWMGTNGRTTAEEIFSWDIIANEILTIYNS